MSGKSLSISRVMMTIAVVAANCALMREVPWEIRSVPTVWCALGIVDYMILRKLILRRPVRAAHYTFLIVFAIAFIVLVNLAAAERIHPTGPMIRCYQRVTGDLTRNTLLIDIAWLGDLWLAALTGFLIALSAGSLAGSLERRRRWDIAAFFRGALVGFGIAGLFGLLTDAVLGHRPPGSAATRTNQIVLAVFVILGGKIGLSRLRSKELEGRTSGTETLAPFRQS